MSGRFDGKSVLVTGGNSGLGLGAVAHFVQEGATVFMVGRRQEELEKAQAELGSRAIAIQCDVTSQADLDRMVATIKGAVPQLDVVVANAGAAIFQPLGSYTHEGVDATFALNLSGTIFTVQGTLPLLPDGASVVLMSSIEGLRGSPGLGAYAATKAALQSLARTWANELRSRKIRVNAISPGVVYTAAYSVHGLSVSDMDPVIPLIPAGRLGEADEIARAIAFLASDDSSFVNGENLVVDGGQTGIV